MSWAKHNPGGNYPSGVQYWCRDEITRPLVRPERECPCVNECREVDMYITVDVFHKVNWIFFLPENSSFRMCPRCKWLMWLYIFITGDTCGGPFKQRINNQGICFSGWILQNIQYVVVGGYWTLLKNVVWTILTLLWNDYFHDETLTFMSCCGCSQS